MIGKAGNLVELIIAKEEFFQVWKVRKIEFKLRKHSYGGVLIFSLMNEF